MTEKPWQLRLFEKSLKKKQKIATLRKHVGELGGKRCLLVTCGDNNGAMNYHIRQWGGTWTWAELEERHLASIEELLQEPVTLIDSETCRLPFEDAAFDCVIIIDSHEHLEDPHPFNLEVARVTKAGGRVVVSVPNGDEGKLAVRIKKLVGMKVKDYGHVVVGYEAAELGAMLAKAGLEPSRSSSYSKFFTEMLELCINFAYVKVLAKRSRERVEQGTIAPTSKAQLESVNKTYRLYSLIYPLFLLCSKLDAALFFMTGYAVVVEAKKAEEGTLAANLLEEPGRAWE